MQSEAAVCGCAWLLWGCSVARRALYSHVFTGTSEFVPRCPPPDSQWIPFCRQPHTRSTWISRITTCRGGGGLGGGGGIADLNTPRIMPPVRPSTNSIASGSAPRREANSQPISLLVRQAVSQAVGQAGRQTGRQADRNTQFGFFQWRTRLQAVESLIYSRKVSGPVVMQPTANSPVGGSNPGRQIAGCAARPVSLVVPDPRSNPSEHKLLTPPPPPPHPKKM